MKPAACCNQSSRARGSDGGSASSYCNVAIASSCLSMRGLSLSRPAWAVPVKHLWLGAEESNHGEHGGHGEYRCSKPASRGRQPPVERLNRGLTPPARRFTTSVFPVSPVLPVVRFLCPEPQMLDGHGPGWSTQTQSAHR